MQLYTRSACHLAEGILTIDDPPQIVYVFFKYSIILGVYGNYMSQAQYCEMKFTLVHDSVS